MMEQIHNSNPKQSRSNSTTNLEGVMDNSLIHTKNINMVVDSSQSENIYMSDNIGMSSSSSPSRILDLSYSHSNVNIDPESFQKDELNEGMIADTPTVMNQINPISQNM